MSSMVMASPAQRSMKGNITPTHFTFFLKKKDSSTRFFDYQKFNKVTDKDSYALPLIDDMLMPWQVLMVLHNQFKKCLFKSQTR